MKRNEYYNIIHKGIDNLSNSELKLLVENMARKIPFDSEQEVLHMLKKENLETNNKIKAIKEDLKRINDEELLFHGEFAEFYEYDYYGFVGWSYTDPENLNETISKSFYYAKDLICNGYYSEALEILDTIIDTKYSLYDERTEDIYDVSLIDVEDLLSISVKEICSYILYAIYQMDNTNYEKIFNYLKRELFVNSYIEDIELCGSEIPKDMNTFMSNWINYLLRQDDDKKIKYIKEAFEYLNFENYEEYVEEIINYVPSLTINLLQNFLDKDNIKTAIDLSNNILLKINDNNIRAEILKLIMPYDEENENEYLFNIFKITYNINDLLELLIKTNKYNNELQSINYSFLNDEEEYIIELFLKKFSIIKTVDCKYKNISMLFLITSLDSKNHLFIENLLADTFFINKALLHKWKEDLDIDLETVNEIIKVLSLYIDSYFEMIIEKRLRKEYSYCALVIAILGEYATDKTSYYKKYLNIAKNRETFRKELKKYREK